MKDVARQAYLLDCYGALLTEKQRDIYEWYYQQDLSLGEIGELAGVSRNAVFDLINRTSEKLERYEASLGLVAASENQDKAQAELAACFSQWLKENSACLKESERDKLAFLIRKIRDTRDVAE